MRNSPHRICPHAHRIPHQLPAVGITEDTFLGKGHYLDFHKVFQLFPEFQYGFQSQQRRVGHVDMGTYILDSVIRIHANRAADPLPYINLVQLTFPFRPAFDAFKQRPGPVPDRITRSQAGIQMDMGFNKRRKNQPAPQVRHIFACFRQQLCSDFRKQTVFNPDIL